MTLIPIHCLAASDLARLGHNLLPTVRRDRDEHAAAVHRSLASVGEDVEWFDTPAATWPGEQANPQPQGEL